MASQLAQLLVESDLAELEEIVSRWLKEAPTEYVYKLSSKMGEKLIELKRQMERLPHPPRREDLELALSMMFDLALARKPGGDEG
ncbi:MAG: hypothetical protein FWD57_13460 [Polyangiaceae bacterium]|nr:hypothetical protein [Polyangiaceae bacterium]